MEDKEYNSASEKLEAEPGKTKLQSELQKVDDELRKVKLSSEEVVNYYDKWSENGKYEEEVPVEKYNGPRLIAKETASLFPPSDRPNIEILDVGAGTGFVGEELSKLGIENVDALDPSKGMLGKAKEKNVYRNYICDFIGPDTMQNANGKYDCLVTSGCLVPNHIKADALHNFIRLTKKGGKIVLAMILSDKVNATEYSQSIQTEMIRLEESGKWKKCIDKDCPNYTHQMPGKIYVFEVI